MAFAALHHDLLVKFLAVIGLITGSEIRLVTGSHLARDCLVGIDCGVRVLVLIAGKWVVLLRLVKDGSRCVSITTGVADPEDLMLS